MSVPAVTAVVLSWNDLASLTRCLDSLARSAYPRLRVLVVDNASEKYDAALEVAKRPDVEVLLNRENLGVAGGRNAGLSRLLGDPDTEFILMLDDDTEQHPEMIERLVASWSPGAGRAILGPAIYELQSPDRLTSLGGRWNPYTGRSSHVLPRSGKLPPAGSFPPLDFIIGCGFFTHRSVYEAVGGFDEAFRPYYGEDIDFCLRAGKLGFPSACVPHAILFHRVSHASGGARFNPRYAFNKGEKTILLMQKHGERRHWMVFLLTQSLFIAGAALREGARGNLSAVGALVRGMWRPLRDRARRGAQ